MSVHSQLMLSEIHRLQSIPAETSQTLRTWRETEK